MKTGLSRSSPSTYSPIRNVVACQLVRCSALYVQDAGRKHVPHNIQAGFSRADRVAKIEVRRFGKVIRAWDVYLCLRYRTLPL